MNAAETGAAADGNFVVDVLGSLPPYLWFGLLVFLLIRYRSQIEQLFRRLTGFKGMGVELAFAAASLDEAVAERKRFLAPAALDQGPKADAAHRTEVPELDRKRALERARASLDLLAGKRLLWVDDIPANNRNERRMLRGLGMVSDAAVSTEEALARLGRDESQFDLLISDMARDGDPQAGMKLVAGYAGLVEKQGRTPDDRLPLIFYLGRYDPKDGTPAGAFGITNRPDQLLHLVIDALAQTNR
ncbi:MAG: hypothetical protein ACREJ0_03325 [Geminicoccaceae bacterium]